MLEVNRKLVYLFGFSPWKTDQLNNLLELVNFQVKNEASVSIVLIHDGVIGISKKGLTPEGLKRLIQAPIKLHAMIPDLEARGFTADNVMEGISCISYDQLTDILIHNDSVISWL